MANDTPAIPFEMPDAKAFVALYLAKLRDTCGEHEECCSALLQYLPSWHGKAETVEDVLQLVCAAQVDLPKIIEGGTLPPAEQVLLAKAFAGTLINALEPHINAGMDSYFRGLKPGEAVAKLVLVFVKSMRAKRKGGRSTAKWTPEIESIARQIFDELKRANLSDHAAYTRTIAKLKSEHGISIGLTTIKRHLVASPNA